jgi:predicted lactoylglutathione lyase
LCDPAKSTEAIIAFSAESRQAVDELFDKAIKSGGTESRPAEDHGWMYSKSFQDPDGHLWEIVWMDPAASPGS